MKVLSCNIRYSGAQDGSNSWTHRKEICADVIRSQTPSIICFQEMWEQQFHYLRSMLADFESFGIAGEACGRHPQNCIFYLRDAFTRISAGGYWLSETPHVPGSKSWDSDCIRLANWIRLEDNATKCEFRIISTHLDHVSQIARERQAELIVQDARAYPDDYPQILSGDMNCDCTNKAIGIFKAGGFVDSYALVHGSENPGCTYHEFIGPEYESSIGKMDWIFVRGGLKVVEAEVVKDSRNGKFPSDHYFVSATIDPANANNHGEHATA